MCIIGFFLYFIIQDLKFNVRKVVDFLSVDCDEEFINMVVEKCIFKNMKNGKEVNF